MAGYLICN